MGDWILGGASIEEEDSDSDFKRLGAESCVVDLLPFLLSSVLESSCFRLTCPIKWRLI